MRASTQEINRILDQEGVVVRRDHPELATALAWRLRQGQLVAVLPAVYARPGRAGDFELRLRALCASDPDAVLTGATAARVSFWPGLRRDVVECATRRQHAPRGGFVFRRSVVPPELVQERAGLRFTVPALAALDLCGELGGDGIDQALRTRTATLGGLWRALELTPGRAGNAVRRALLLDSRDQPWSAAERRAHRLLRTAGITGWQSNHPVVVEGRLYFLDIAFPGVRLVLEIDGRLHEDDPAVFENDRQRQNALVLEGWTVLRFTWRMLEADPAGFVAAVLAALDGLR
jgi:very-short-patch-repair endonuclease